MVQKFAENEYVILSTEENILHLEYKPEVCVNLTVAKEIISLISSVCNDERYLVLLDLSNLNWIDKDSRNFFASHPTTNQMLAFAFYSQNQLHQVIYNIYLTFSKPEVKSEFFRNSQEGIKWLLQVEQTS